MKIVFANESWFNVNRSILIVTSLADVLGRSRRDVFIPQYWENIAKNLDENSLPYLLDMPHNTKVIHQSRREPHHGNVVYNTEIVKTYDVSGTDLIDLSMIDVTESVRLTEELQTANENLKTLVNVDSLTGVLSRQGFLKRSLLMIVLPTVMFLF